MMYKPNRSKYGLTIEIMKNCISKTQPAVVEEDTHKKNEYCMIFFKRHKWNGHLNASIMDPLSGDRVKDQVKEVCRRDDSRTTTKKRCVPSNVACARRCVSFFSSIFIFSFISFLRFQFKFFFRTSFFSPEE